MTHVSAVCRAVYYQLRQLRPLTRLLSSDAAKMLVQAFISSRLHYCNSLLYRISDSLYRRLQAVQNATARLIINTRRCEHITPVLQQLHWLPVRQRVQFKMSCLYTLLPAYLAEDCHLVCHWTDIRRACGSKPSHVLAITHSLLLDLAYETVCQPSYTGTVSRSTQNASVWSLTAAALSDSFFVRCEQICLPYLLTYYYYTIQILSLQYVLNSWVSV